MISIPRFCEGCFNSVLADRQIAEQSQGAAPKLGLRISSMVVAAQAGTSLEIWPWGFAGEFGSQDVAGLSTMPSFLVMLREYLVNTKMHFNSRAIPGRFGYSPLIQRCW
jgi:hypothetical protein